MAESLAVKYRPKEFVDVCGQSSIIHIFQKQLELRQFKNTYLLSGPSGCGKTTIARIFARKINNDIGNPIEIDAASNNGVDNVKNIIKSANERALDGEYKIYIIDEAHMITIQGWNAFLKCLEEPPSKTIFIFCTTDPQKIPNTIINRMQRFAITKINTNQIMSRLEFICIQEGCTNYTDAIKYIADISDGGMRDAISNLEKCISYNSNLDIVNVLNCLGDNSYNTFFKLINNIIDGNEKNVLEILQDIYITGVDTKTFVDKFIDFCFDVTKYILFKNFNIIKIPSYMQQQLDSIINFDNASNYYNYVIDKLINLKSIIKQDTNIKTTTEIIFMQITRCH